MTTNDPQLKILLKGCDNEEDFLKRIREYALEPLMDIKKELQNIEKLMMDKN
jgi:hypothetical protein